MNTLAKFFIDNSKFTIVLSIFVLVFGLGGFLRLKSESFPAVDFAMAIVTTNYDGATAQDIETQITKPIEDEIRKVSGIKDVRSVSQAGVSRIFVRADIDNVDVPTVMADLQRSVDRVTTLPSDLKDRPVFQEIKSEEFPVIELAIVGDNPDRARDRVADLLKEELEDNKNVLSVRFAGFKERRFQVVLDQQKLIRSHIGINEVIGKIQARNVNIPGGHLKETDTQQLLRIEGKIANKEQLENIAIRANFSGQKILLKDVAEVKDAEEEGKVIAQYNGKEATLLIVTKKAGADTVALVDDIDTKLETFRNLHKDFEFVVYNNEGLKVKNRLQVLSSNALSGLLLVVFFLLVFLPGRTGLMASLSLPLAVLITIGMMPSLGMNLDAVTILALVIALGMMVDNSVVMSENFSRLRGEGLNARDAALKTVASLWLPITATAFTTIAAFLPMLVTKGIMGEFIKFIPIIVSIALLASLFESFIFLPMRLTYGGERRKEGEAPRNDWFQRIFITRFRKFVALAVNHRYWSAVVFTMVLIGSGLMLSVGNKFILFPPDQTEIYVGRVSMERGTRLEATSKALEDISLKVKQQLGENIVHVVARAGVSQVRPDDPKSKEGNNVGMFVMYVNDYTKNNVPHTQILSALRKIDTGKAEVHWEEMVNGPPVGEPVNATFRSNNRENLEKVVGEVKATLMAIEGLGNVQVDDVMGDNEVYVDINHQRAGQLGMDVNLIGSTIRSAMSGRIISSVNLNNKEIDINVRLNETARKNLQDLSSVKIMDSQGNLVPLSSLATFRTQPGAPQIKRFDYKRSKTLTAIILDEKLTAVEANAALKDKFNELQASYPDVSLVFGGEEENTKESMESLFNALVLSLIGIFALLVFLFRSYLRPLIIMSTIPLGLVGFSIAFALHGRPVSFLALIGTIGLGGIIVNSGIVLISFIDSMREEGNRPLNEVLVDASALRLRAVIVTALTTIMGLLPTAYGIGGSDAILIPMTLAMAWGLTSGTILTLVWVPCAYGILEDFSRWISKPKPERSQPEIALPQKEVV